jgi:endonuclease/exonuclease/phosphatase (EEP) superfamily protein YafD
MPNKICKEVLEVFKNMSKWKFIGLIFTLSFVVVLLWANTKYKIFAINASNDCDFPQLRVLTWNICGSNIENEGVQKGIARLVIAQDADFVQLNEFTSDSCLVIDSLLSEHYPYREDVNAKVRAGDVFYSKWPLVESGKYKTGIKNKTVQALQSKVIVNKDSVLIIGCHLWGNNHQGQIGVDNTDSIPKVKTFWGHYRNAQEKRKENLGNIKKKILECQLPAIVMGDMNDFNVSAPMDSLKDAGMKNAWWEGGFGYGATYHEGWLRLRIDHIYYNDKLRLKDVKVVKTDLSVHNILIADFSVVN